MHLIAAEKKIMKNGMMHFLQKSCQFIKKKYIYKFPLLNLLDLQMWRVSSWLADLWFKEKSMATFV